MFEDLKEKELEIYLYLKRYIENNGYPPTVREICNGLNIKSTSTVHNNLERLEFKGYIKKSASKSRTLEITNINDDIFVNSSKTINIPLINDILMDSVFSVDNITDNYNIDSRISPGNYPYIYRIKNNNLKKYDIEKYDYIILDKNTEVKINDKVLAIIDGNIELVILEKINNEAYKIINTENNIIHKKKLKIFGIIKGIFKKY